MVIKSLKLDSYRNYDTCELSFSSGINILYGDNAQGKTNILEAVYMSATSKSHRGSKDKEIIGFSKQQAHIRSLWDREGMEYRIDMQLRRDKSKGIAINGQGIKKSSQLLGICNVVFFSPEDLTIIKNGPVERRRFMDMELCQIDASYLYHLSQYNKVIGQRNALLRDLAMRPDHQREEFEGVLSVWDQQLVSYGTKIIERRKKYNEDLNTIIEPIHRELSGQKENLRILYKPNTEAEFFESRLAQTRSSDLKYKMTTAGPHKDDLIIECNGIDLRRYGSQGQQRSAALSLKLSEIEMILKIKKEAPVLLLDDVLSELDSNRQNDLISRIGNIQTIITCTGLDEFVNRRIKLDKVYQVKKGSVELLSLK